MDKKKAVYEIIEALDKELESCPRSIDRIIALAELVAKVYEVEQRYEQVVSKKTKELMREKKAPEREPIMINVYQTLDPRISSCVTALELRQAMAEHLGLNPQKVKKNLQKNRDRKCYSCKKRRFRERSFFRRQQKMR